MIKVKWIFNSIFLGMLFLANLYNLANAQNHFYQKGLESFSHAHWQQARQQFTSAIHQAKKSKNRSAEIDAMLSLSDTYHVLGEFQSSITLLKKAQTLVANDEQRAVGLVNRLGTSYLSLGDYDQAEHFLKHGISLAKKLKMTPQFANLYNDLGRYYIALNQPKKAQPAFSKSSDLAKQTSDKNLQISANINLIRVLIENGNEIGLRTQLESIANLNQTLVNKSKKANTILAIGKLYRDAQHKFDLPEQWRSDAFQHYQQGQKLAELIQDKNALSYALGYLGQLYEDEQRYEHAVTYTRKAIFVAQSVQAKESLYRWEWQMARLYRAQGDLQEAINAYRQALFTLSEIRLKLTTGTRNTFKQIVGPIYFELADLLLKRAHSNLADAEAAQKDLMLVRDTLEQVKIAEVEDYFENKCFTVNKDKTILDDVSTQSAIIYPVILKDRLELLVSFGNEMKQYRIPVSAKIITRQIRNFRRRVEIFDSHNTYRGPAEKLYDWLITPLETELVKHQVETLVIVPGGPLRTIPLAALYNGKEFLIEQYAVVTTPGIKLTSPESLPVDQVKVLAYGLTKAVQGYEKLPNVQSELDNISGLFESEVYVDDSFLISKIEQNMRYGKHNIIHLATHGEFNSDPRKSFILTFDNKLTMDRLEDTVGIRRYQEQPLELLVLSACKTAAGDDRAALGLAGIALKSGARSAIATLWFTNDVANAQLISIFYDTLKKGKKSKAQALRYAQTELIKEERFSHPQQWAPFLLIGNWL